jgi:glycerophosphoryl diester phosphodiesterase
MLLKIGHRGARALEPENTLRSFQRAVELGVDAVELDVRRTADGEVVVIHDDKMDRTTDGSGLVSERTLEEIKGFKTRGGDSVPTLGEALDFLKGKVKVLIELKEVGFEEKVLKLVKERGMVDDVIIVSFSDEALRRVRELDEGVSTGLIYVRHKKPIEAALGLGTEYLLPLYRFTHSADVKKAHEVGLKVIVWTINTPEEATAYKHKGVDGIATDKPNIFKTQKQ